MNVFDQLKKDMCKADYSEEEQEEVFRQLMGEGEGFIANIGLGILRLAVDEEGDIHLVHSDLYAAMLNAGTIPGFKTDEDVSKTVDVFLAMNPELASGVQSLLDVSCAAGHLKAMWDDNKGEFRYAITPKGEAFAQENM